MLLGELLIELVVEVMAEALIELGFSSVGHSFRRREQENPFLSGLGILLLGAFLGLVMFRIVPERILSPSPAPAVSLLVSPLNAGLVMHFFGSMRRKRGKASTHLATFWGGALFAFAAALVRWLLVGNA